jgi:hypothetical protein
MIRAFCKKHVFRDHLSRFSIRKNPGTRDLLRSFQFLHAFEDRSLSVSLIFVLKLVRHDLFVCEIFR